MANNTLTTHFSVVLPAVSPGWGVAASLQQLAGALSTSLPVSIFSLKSETTSYYWRQGAILLNAMYV